MSDFFLLCLVCEVPSICWLKLNSKPLLQKEFTMKTLLLQRLAENKVSVYAKRPINSSVKINSIYLSHGVDSCFGSLTGDMFTPFIFATALQSEGTPQGELCYSLLNGTWQSGL